MKRGFLIFLLGLIAATAAYGGVFFASTSSARALRRSDRPELAWLKTEFKLSDAEFERVSALHSAYLPRCGEMCRKIEAQNIQLQKLIAGATSVTPELDAALAEAGRLRSECQRMMLAHFIQVSQAMPPEQGNRYLAWVKEKAFLPDYGMSEKP